VAGADAGKPWWAGEKAPVGERMGWPDDACGNWCGSNGFGCGCPWNVGCGVPLFALRASLSDICHAPPSQ
jgi:hypothetical protein